MTPAKPTWFVQGSARAAYYVRTSAILVLLMSTKLIAGAASEGFDRLVEAHYLQNLNMPVLTGSKILVRPSQQLWGLTS